MLSVGYVIFGGAIVVGLLGLLVGLAFRSKDPTTRAVQAVGISFAICSVVSGFALAKGGAFRLEASVYFLPGATLSLFYLHAHYRKRWRADDTVAEGRYPLD